MENDDLETSDATLPATAHGSLPVQLPDLSHLTIQELSAFRTHIASQSKDARKKATQLLGKLDAPVRAMWMATLSTKGSEAERKLLLSDFQRELLRTPKAYVAYCFANSFVVLDEAIRAEQLRRTKIMDPR